MSAPKLPPTSVRGQVRAWIDAQAIHLGDDVLEVGARQHEPNAWWLVNRDLAQGRWLGIDMQPGRGVDVVADLHELPHDWTGRFTGVLCSEVLEHVRWPWVALAQIHRVMSPGAWLVITAPFCFPRHAYPSDYFRYTEDGLRELLLYAGFAEVLTAYSRPQIAFALNDHGEPGLIRRIEPTHAFAVARKPLERAA